MKSTKKKINISEYKEIKHILNHLAGIEDCSSPLCLSWIILYNFIDKIDKLYKRKSKRSLNN